MFRGERRMKTAKHILLSGITALLIAAVIVASCYLTLETQIIHREVFTVFIYNDSWRFVIGIMEV